VIGSYTISAQERGDFQVLSAILSFVIILNGPLRNSHRMNDLRVSDGTSILDQSSWIESATLDARAKLRQPRAVAPENKRVIGRITQAKFYFVSNLKSIVDKTIHASRLPTRVGIDKMLRIGRVAIGIVAMLRVKGIESLVTRGAEGLVLIDHGRVQ